MKIIKSRPLSPFPINVLILTVVLGLFGPLLSACSRPGSGITYYNDAESRFRVHWVGQKTLNSYNAEVLWPVDPTVKSYEIRQLHGTDMAHLKPDENQSRVLIGPLQSGQRLELELWAEKQNVWTRVKTLIEEVPHDAVVAGVRTWNSIFLEQRKTPYRVYLSAGSQLVTEGLDLDLEIDELHSDGGKIITYAENQKAANDQPGRPAGKVHLKIKSLEGMLGIEMRGEAGGDGHTGRNGGNGANVFYNNSSYCQPTTPTGGPGENGENGAPGQIGGGAGDLILHVGELKPASAIAIRSQPGSHGTGGLGGIGGRGGLPDPRIAAAVRDCGKAASEGLPGSPGRSGADGRDGILGNIFSNVPYSLIGSLGDR
jgi:hypothetical protein